MSNRVIILLGSNLENREAYLQKANRLLGEAIGPLTMQSSIYESEPWGFESSNWFLNRVLISETELNAVQSLRACLDIEIKMGRQRSAGSGYTSRCIDIDILFFNDEIINTENLTVPHPKLHERRFTLLPLNEIMPVYCHPSLKKTITQLLAECKDELAAREFKF